jgi:hypothetical protein
MALQGVFQVSGIVPWMEILAGMILLSLPAAIYRCCCTYAVLYVQSDCHAHFYSAGSML